MLGGLKANLIFQNNVKGTHSATVTMATNLALVPVGGSITLPKQPVLGGVGGNPWIWLQFFDSKGNILTDEIRGGSPTGCIGNGDIRVGRSVGGGLQTGESRLDNRTAVRANGIVC